MTLLSSLRCVLAAAALVAGLSTAQATAQTATPATPAEPDEEAVFLSVIEDIPLMPGLVEDEARALVFDAAQGRLAETYARGKVEAKAVREFYGETLPALGWRAEGRSRWVREGEVLTLDIADQADGLDVRFSLSPARVR
jgi:hypothetical protein